MQHISLTRADFVIIRPIINIIIIGMKAEYHIDLLNTI